MLRRVCCSGDSFLRFVLTLFKSAILLSKFDTADLPLRIGCANLSLSLTLQIGSSILPAALIMILIAALLTIPPAVLPAVLLLRKMLEFVSTVATQQDCDTAEMRNCRVARRQSVETVELGNGKTAEFKLTD